MRGEKRGESPMRAGSELRVPVAVIGWAGTRALTTCHTGATCQHCTCVQYSTHCTVSHQQHHYILSHRQSVSNSGSSQTLVTKKNYFCGYPIVVKDWKYYLIEIRIVNDIDEEFYLWISWPWQSSWHCKYIFWLEEKSVCPKNSSCTQHFWDELYGHVTLTRAWVGNLLMWSEISSGTMLITKWPWHKTLMWWKNIRLIKIQQFSAAA